MLSSSIIAPITIIPEMALVTLIKGVCREGVTFHITKYPRKIANTNERKRLRKSPSVPIATKTNKADKIRIVRAHPTHYPDCPLDFVSADCNFMMDYCGLCSYLALMSL